MIHICMSAARSHYTRSHYTPLLPLHLLLLLLRLLEEEGVGGALGETVTASVRNHRNLISQRSHLIGLTIFGVY